MLMKLTPKGQFHQTLFAKQKYASSQRLAKKLLFNFTKFKPNFYAEI